MANYWILIAFVAFTMFVQGEAIKCWACGAATTKECGDEPDTSKMTEMDDCKYCLKTKTINPLGDHSVSRGCVSNDAYDAMAVTDIQLGCKSCTDCHTTNEMCYCDGEKCNHAATALVSMATMIAALAFFKLFQ